LICVDERMEQIPEEIELFAAWLAARQLHHVLEIGVRFGGTAALWHQLSTGVVVGVDWFETDSLGVQETLRLAVSMQQKYPRYRFVRGDSHAVETRDRVQLELNNEPIDLLFIDGDHTFAGVTRDFELYRPLVRPGGCVAFHDIVDSKLIRAAGHGVYKFWEAVEGQKREFCVHAQWGGIGVIEV
jgi:cephalosporin hydroxylase